MAAIDDLLQKVSDPVLRERLTKEIQKLKNKKGFGLVFEEHMPECTPLYEIPVAKGSCVAPRDKEIKETFTVTKVDGDTAHCISNIDKSPHDFCVKDIVVTAEIGEPIYPYLKELDRICNAPENDAWHTLIEADNYHALQLLKYMYAGKVDCIYIDPPYNTGAKDWKYNNRFVDSSDAYPHSKWLSFMKRRLALAKELLNPEDSVLIVTIDEKEYLRLGMLLDDMFKDARIQMVSSIINAKGVARDNEFFRANEYIYIVRFGKCCVQKLKLDDEWLGNIKKSGRNKLRLGSMLRSGSNSHRSHSQGCFFPIYFHKDGTYAGTGAAIQSNIDRHSVSVPADLIPVWPIHADGSEGVWQYSRAKFEELVEAGFVYFGKLRGDRIGISYAPKGVRKKIEEGLFRINGINKDGSLIIDDSDYVGTFIPNNQWSIPSHNATEYGTKLNQYLLPDRKFPYPKSLYAVEDCIRFFISNKPNALILDFFAGSGTAAHATMLLNHLDGGHRRCISVTNNEISAEEEKKFVRQGLRHGDPQWEARGIARYVTWPRIKAAITGINTLGEPIKGSYKFNEEFPMSDGFAENAVYFKLGFLDRNAVALGRQFRELLPVLWMKAGCIGPCPQTHEGNEIPDMMILPQNKMAVLIDETSFASFAKEMENHPEIETVYIITDSERGYREMIHTLGVKNTYRLYRDYLENFRINLKG